MQKYIVCSGNPVTGFKFHGTFNSIADAHEFGKFIIPYVVAELENVSEEFIKAMWDMKPKTTFSA